MNKNSTPWGTVVVVILVGVVVYILSNPDTLAPPFGQYQSTQVVQKRYAECKAGAPKNMDCVMIAMLVSNTVAKQLGAKP